MSEPLTLHATFSGGIGSLEVEPDHPLVGPWRVAILKGRPPGQWLWFGVIDQFTGVCKVIGSFAHTPGNRLLYFPGASISLDTEDEDLQPGRIDHLTLDPPTSKGRHSSHIALLNGVKTRGINYSSRPPRGYLLPWFTLLTPNLMPFFAMPADLRVSFPSPRPDVASLGRDLLKGPGLTVVPLPPGGVDTFFQMDVWVGRTKDWQSLAVRPLSWAYKAELVTNAPPDAHRVQVIDQKVDFDASTGLRILCLRPRGQLAGAHILRPTVQQ